MSTKADYDIMHQKVSLEYFEMTKRTNSMLQLISQITSRENDWQKNLIEISKVFESKINKDETAP